MLGRGLPEKIDNGEFAEGYYLEGNQQADPDVREK